MPTRKKPAYTLHRPTGQARVRINGQDHYLGAFGSPESRDRYDDLVAEWFVRQDTARVRLTVDDLCLLYLRHAETYYVKHGTVTSEVQAIRSALRPLVKQFGVTRAREFGPLRLKAVREAMIAQDWARTTINRAIDRIRRMFRWAVECEHLPPSVAGALAAVPGLRKGRTNARESATVRSVDEPTVDATLPYLSSVVADMVRFQRLTACRPGEVCLLRPGDLNRSGAVWVYTPAVHKTEHHDLARQVYIGGAAQEVLAPYLQRADDRYCFSPGESALERQAARSARRRTPPNQGNRPGTNRCPRPRRTPRDHYTVASYRRAIDRAIDRACRLADLAAHLQRPDVPAEQPLIPAWHPNQLRHAAATRIRQRFGLEASQVILGHRQANVTEIYAERDSDLARRVAAEIG